MNKIKLFIYPTGGSNPTTLNPYIRNMKQCLATYFDLVDPYYKIKIPRMAVLLLQSFRADIYVLNWIENSAQGIFGGLGGLMAMGALKIIKVRKSKIVWIIHNIQPHSGETFWSKCIKNFLFLESNYIITHSKEAEEYATKYSRCPVFFKNHPMKIQDYGEWNGTVRECDYFFWGTILPYKGVYEFLSNPVCKKSKRKILIIGRCNNEQLNKKIEALTSDNIIFENRTADFYEIASQCLKAKYVVFPYVGDSISSSGALMDTLMMGGIPIGPNRGAFSDLAKKGCCLTYNSIDEIFSLPIDDDNRIYLDSKKVKNFISCNSWDAFALWMYGLTIPK